MDEHRFAQLRRRNRSPRRTLLDGMRRACAVFMVVAVASAVSPAASALSSVHQPTSAYRVRVDHRGDRESIVVQNLVAGFKSGRLPDSSWR